MTEGTSKPPDPADNFQPVHRNGYRTDREKLSYLLDYFTRHPHATARSGEAGFLVSYIKEHIK